MKENLRQFVENSYDKWCLNNLPTAVLVTGKSLCCYFGFTGRRKMNSFSFPRFCSGVNQGDHYQFFDTFTNEIREHASVAVIQGRNCLTLKSAINTMVFGLIGQHITENVCEINSLLDGTNSLTENRLFLQNDESLQCNNMRRSQYNIQVLKSWYDETFGSNGPTLTVVIPDFELFRKDVLTEFIQLLLTMNDDIPMVLVLGVATDISILQRSLPSHIINKLQLCKFQSSPSKQSLEKVNEVRSRQLSVIIN